MAEIYVSAELRNKILDALTGRAKNTQIGAGASYLALSSTAPSYNASGEITGITEPTAAGYTRRLLGLSDQSATMEMSSASNGKTANADEIHFDQIPADGSGWGANATHWVNCSMPIPGKAWVSSPVTATAPSPPTPSCPAVICSRAGRWNTPLPWRRARWSSSTRAI